MFGVLVLWLLPGEKDGRKTRPAGGKEGRKKKGQISRKPPWEKLSPRTGNPNKLEREKTSGKDYRPSQKRKVKRKNLSVYRKGGEGGGRGKSFMKVF